MVAVLQRRELMRIAGQLSDELGMPFNEVKVGEQIEGKLIRQVETMSGRQALIERSRDFTLVPWRPILERRIGSTVSGRLREGGYQLDNRAGTRRSEHVLIRTSGF
jgi:hypothetical protein